ncbi:hypothetical protein PV08_11521 [Exophiala spinifera]|uniref:Hypervirulence associated protein TUDOR domain-containing protein n=1 Tax=Exophiala spinifera TaxID=91928 RepID=A0A0D1ZC36_9EURO|nr:uncharacterized protein PV08_11521 [Exophiala spinifera]KIW10557.1 hypothetical protein PV08_11521 [Exophiala spinifera]
MNCSEPLTFLKPMQMYLAYEFVTFSWNWGGGAPGGTVAEKKHEGEVSITSKRGNKVKKNAEPNNPAVKIERSGNDVVKKASELNIVSKANGTGSGGHDKGKDEAKEKKAGDKRKHDGETDGEKNEDNGDGSGGGGGLEENAEGKTVRPGGKTDNTAKKQKKDDTEKKDESKNTEKGKGGRPKKSEGASSPKPKKKNSTPRSTEGIASRTRSQKK